MPSSSTYGALINWIVAFITLAAVLLFNLLGKGVVKSASILLGAAVGYVVSVCMGMVHFDGVLSADWIAVPKPFFFGMPVFDVSMVLPVVLITVVNVMQAVGDMTGTTVGGFDREPTQKDSPAACWLLAWPLWWAPCSVCLLCPLTARMGHRFHDQGGAPPGHHHRLGHHAGAGRGA